MLPNCQRRLHSSQDWLWTSNFTGCKAGANQLDYLTIKFTDVTVSSYTTSGAGDVPVDNISFSFAKMDIEYKPQNPDGMPGVPVTATWDTKLVKKL